MSIKLSNTLTRKKEAFVPLRDNEVRIYVCGPTVYDEPHIGHARSAYIFDVIRRYFIYKGYKVKFVRNVTDIDDKIINKAREEFGEQGLIDGVNKISDRYIKIYHDYMNKLGIMPPDVEPKATEYIPKMIEFISGLIRRGAGYESDGDVYFDVRRFPGYGRLSNQSLEMLESGVRIMPGENKRDPLDFALWKSAKEGEPSWDSPWGKGRPGWHIECSVMSLDILGDEFDIHGGGIDLVFPHHENEIAQSVAAGKNFARYWIHNGLLTINKEKMAKSAGNFITIEDILKRYPADVLKIFFLQAHYSHPVDFSWERMEDAKKAYERIDILMKKLKDVEIKNDSDVRIDRYRKNFEEVMDDDFSTAQALGVIFEMISFINKNIEDRKILGYAKKVFIELGKVLGFSEELLLQKEDVLSDIGPGISKYEIEELIRRRDIARKSKNFKEADSIRERLEKAGIVLEDTKDGTVWRKRV